MSDEIISKIHLGNIAAEIVGALIKNIHSGAGNFVTGIAAGHPAAFAQIYRLINTYYQNDFGKYLATPLHAYLGIKTISDGTSGVLGLLNGDLNEIYNIASAVAHGSVLYELNQDVIEDWGTNSFVDAYRDFFNGIRGGAENLSNRLGTKQRQESLEEKVE